MAILKVLKVFVRKFFEKNFLDLKKKFLKFFEKKFLLKFLLSLSFIVVIIIIYYCYHYQVMSSLKQYWKFFLLEIAVLSCISSSCVYASRKLQKLQSPVRDCNFVAFSYTFLLFSCHFDLFFSSFFFFFCSIFFFFSILCNFCGFTLTRIFKGVKSCFFFQRSWSISSMSSCVNSCVLNDF